MRKPVISSVCVMLFLVSCQKAANDSQPAADRTAPQASIRSAEPPAGAKPDEARDKSPIIRASMSQEFLDAFNEAKECHGIQIAATDAKTKPDFRVQAVFGTADTPEKEEEWRWTVFDLRHDANGEFRGAGNQTSPALAMRDMCVDIQQTFSHGDGATKGTRGS